MKPEEKQKIPKKAISKPSIISFIFFIIIMIVWVPHILPFFMNMASMQIIFAIFLAPLAIVVYSLVSAALFLPAYYGIYRYREWLAKYNLPKPV